MTSFIHYYYYDSWGVSDSAVRCTQSLWSHSWHCGEPTAGGSHQLCHSAIQGTWCWNVSVFFKSSAVSHDKPSSRRFAFSSKLLSDVLLRRSSTDWPTFTPQCSICSNRSLSLNYCSFLQLIHLEKGFDALNCLIICFSVLWWHNQLHRCQ